MVLVDFFISYIEQLSYIAILVLLFIGSFGIPFPEEIILLAAGYVASLHFMNIIGAIVVCFVGVILGDLIGYWIGHRGGGWFKRLLSHENFRLVEEHFERHGSKTIFVSRFLAGIRVFFPIAAGATKMPLRDFLFWDILAALIWTPVMVLLGFWFGRFLPRLVRVFHRVDLAIILAFLLGIIATLIIIQQRKRIERNVERLRHQFFTVPRKDEKPFEVRFFGEKKGAGQRVYAKQRVSDGKITLLIEFLRDGKVAKCLHSKHWLRLKTYRMLVNDWADKLGKPKKEAWPK
jgi:membrane protein DedA with SNARE-associated domain